MKKSGLFCTQLFLNAIRYGLLFVIAVIVTIIGAVWVDICLYIGLGLIALYVIICLGSTISMNMIMKHEVASSCIESHAVASSCMRLHRVAYGCIELHRFASSCMQLHRVASSCMQLHRVARRPPVSAMITFNTFQPILTSLNRQNVVFRQTKFQF